MSGLHELKIIRTKFGTPTGVVLDGKKLKGVNAVKFESTAKEPGPLVTLTLIVKDLEFETEEEKGE